MSDQPQYPSYPGSDGPEGEAGQQPPSPPGQQPPHPAYGQAPPAYGQAPSGYGQAPPGYGQAPPAYGPPGYGYPAPPRANGKAMWSMITGIVSIVFCYLGVFIGPVAIILSVQGKKDIQRSNGTQTGEGMATAGLVTGIVGTVIWFLMDALTIIGFATSW